MYVAQLHLAFHHVGDSGFKIAMVGDLKYSRTVHSLSRALIHYKDIVLYLISPRTLQLPKNITSLLRQSNTTIVYADCVKEILPYIDILYMTRLQKERFQKNEAERYNFVLTYDLLRKYAKCNLAVMHPLPRGTELCTSVDNTNYASYFKQAQNGVFVRQALLYHILTPAT